MKKILLAALAVTALTACRKDDKNDNKQEEKVSKIVGMWQPTKDIIVDGANGAILESEDASDCYKKTRVEFTSDNKMISTAFALVTNGDCEKQEYNGTYEYNETEKKLTVTINGNTKEGEVYEISDTELKIVGNEEDKNGDGVLDKYIEVYKRK